MRPRDVLARLEALDLRTEREATDDVRRERDAAPLTGASPKPRGRSAFLSRR